jgi:hypothetical protein
VVGVKVVEKVDQVKPEFAAAVPIDDPNEFIYQ